MKKLLAKNLSKGNLSSADVDEAIARVQVVPQEQGIKGFRDVDMVIEVCPLSTLPTGYLTIDQRQSPRTSSSSRASLLASQQS